MIITDIYLNRYPTTELLSNYDDYCLYQLDDYYLYELDETQSGRYGTDVYVEREKEFDVIVNPTYMEIDYTVQNRGVIEDELNTIYLHLKPRKGVNLDCTKIALGAAGLEEITLNINVSSVGVSLSKEVGTKDLSLTLSAEAETMTMEKTLKPVPIALELTSSSSSSLDLAIDLIISELISLTLDGDMESLIPLSFGLKTNNEVRLYEYDDYTLEELSDLTLSDMETQNRDGIYIIWEIDKSEPDISSGYALSVGGTNALSLSVSNPKLVKSS